jgi:D-glycero-alpha-D-manno-heptose-7-phosphate kinase
VLSALSVLSREHYKKGVVFMKKEVVIRARAPVRIDFGGGWTDVAIFTEESKGFVLNAAIDIYSYVTVKKLPDKEMWTNSYGYNHKETMENKAVKIYSADFDIYEEAEEVKQLEYNGNIDLAKAAIKQMGIQGGLEILTRSNAPAGSGLGTSASMGVALIGALSAFKRLPLLPYEFAEQASLIERQELGILGGKQDHYSSALGGISFMEFMGEEVKVSKLQLSQDVLYELEKSLVLCYTGKSRLSGDIHRKVREAYEGEEPETRRALRNLKTIAFEMKNTLLKGDLKAFGELLNENWENQKALHPSVTNPQIDEIFEAVMANGALGGKACGAGGGGCLLFYVQPDCEHLVRRKLEENNVSVIDFNFEFSGLQTWTA